VRFSFSFATLCSMYPALIVMTKKSTNITTNEMPKPEKPPPPERTSGESASASSEPNGSITSRASRSSPVRL